MAGTDKIPRMVQPDWLKTQEYHLWSRGRGVDVWSMVWAAATGDLDSIRSLLNRDPDLVHCEIEYFKPIRFAVRHNQRAVVEYLLAKGASPAGEAGATLVEDARDRGYDELAGFLTSLLEKEHHIIPAGETIAAAIKAFDMPRVRALLEAQPQLLHAADKGGSQPIHWASLTRQIALIDYLLDRGADINARRPDGARPLDLTNGDYDYRSWYRDLPPFALRKHEMLAGYLIARGAYCDISVAAKMGWFERVRELLDEDPGVVNRIPAYCGYYSGLPLRCAAAAGHLEVVRLLLERGANPNEPEPGIAPLGGALHAAIGGNHYEVVKLLLEKGANPNAPVESSGNCMSMAKHAGGSKELIDLVASYGGVLGVGMAWHERNVEILAAMLHANPRLELYPKTGSFPGPRHRRCIELVLRFQPDIFSKKRLDPKAWWDGSVPEELTPEEQDHVRWLAGQGADINRPNWLGTTNLHRAAAAGSVRIAGYCLEYGADIDTIEGLYSTTPLGWAAREGKKEMVEWLLARGADPRLPEEEPWAQPLAWAQRRGHHEIAAMLHR